MSRNDYDQLTGLNWSRLSLLRKSPAHFKLGFGDDTSSLKLGTAAHMAVLEPERFAEDYVIFTGKIRRGKEWEAFETEQTRLGKSILNQKEYNEALAIRDAVRGHPKAPKYLTGGKSEVTLEWKLGSGEFSFDCKGRADFIGDCIVDLKTTQCAAMGPFSRSCLKYGYLGQAAWYVDGYEAQHGVRKDFVIIAVESSSPWIVQPFRIPDDLLQRGRDLYQSLLGKLDYCRKANFWGGYSEADVLDLVIPETNNQPEEG